MRGRAAKHAWRKLKDGREHCTRCDLVAKIEDRGGTALERRGASPRFVIVYRRGLAGGRRPAAQDPLGREPPCTPREVSAQ